VPSEGEAAVEQAEIQFFENDEAAIQQMNDVLKALLKINQGLTSNLKDWLAVPLLNYLDFLKNSENLKIKFQQDTLILTDFARKCQMLDDIFDYYNKDYMHNFFKNKQPHNIERYIKVINGLVEKGIQNKTLNKKYIKQVFNGESQTFLKIIKDNLSWLLEKYKYDFDQDQVLKVLTLIYEHHDMFVKPNNPQLKIKLDVQLQKFLAEQEPKFANLKLQEKYGETFFTVDQQKANHEL